MKNNIAWVGFSTLMRKEIIRIMRIWPQTVLPPAITASLYFIIFGSFLGKHVGLVAGVSYAEFLVPGFIMMNAMIGAYSNVSSSFFGAKFQNSIDEILISPMSAQLIMWGYILGGMFRGVMIGLLVFLVSLFFVHINIAHWLLSIVVLVLAMAVFSLAGFINGVFAKKFDDVMIIPTFVITPLTYLGGVFYSIHGLPAFWQEVAKFNPIFYIIDAFRYAMLGHSDITVWLACAFVGGFFILFYFLALYLLKTSDGLRS